MQDLNLTVNKPAWTSISKGIQSIEDIKNHNSEGFVCLVTKTAIYNRVKVVNETSTYITVKYTIFKGGVPKAVTEIINKAEITCIRDYWS